MVDQRIYKALTRNDWVAAEASGATDTALDRKDGYVHLSTHAQVGETLRLHYSGKNDVQLLEFDAGAFGDDLKWEQSRGGDLFPHLYAPLVIERATRVWTLELDETGAPRLPADL